MGGGTIKPSQNTTNLHKIKEKKKEREKKNKTKTRQIIKRYTRTRFLFTANRHRANQKGGTGSTRKRSVSRKNTPI